MACCIYNFGRANSENLESRHDTSTIQKNNQEPLVKIESDYFIVQTGFEEAIRVNELQPAGKKKMSAEDYLRGVGSKLRIGDKFE